MDGSRRRRRVPTAQHCDCPALRICDDALVIERRARCLIKTLGSLSINSQTLFLPRRVFCVLAMLIAAET
jgi:hypothetical protein